ncbi:MAG TPA: ABC transporter permease [Kineosporiaceae bacterium]|nr:ABC transporter permease [Kineosporiaceae bacterium]
MTDLLTFTIVGLFTGAAYAIAASGLVLVYATTKVFNLAHGAMGMVMSFTFWQLSVAVGLQPWFALLLVVLVIAPVFGLVVERVLMRGLGAAPVSVSLVVTVGLFVGLVGLAQTVWPPDSRIVEPFFGAAEVEIGGLFVGYHQILTMVLAVVVAASLYFLLERTRIGLAMRGSVDDPTLLGLYGGSPVRVAQVSWALGTSLGALAGILLIPLLSLDYFQLTFLVINAYTAAVLGRLRNLPLTFVGALLLGVLQAYLVGYLPTGDLFMNLRTVIPMLLLFGLLIFLPPVRFRLGQIRGVPAPPVPSLVRSVAAGSGLVLVVAVASLSMSDSTILQAGTGLVFAMIMLSLVLLTGYSGHVSLAQLSFAGIGALTVAQLNSSSLWALGLAVLVAAVVGGLVALPVMRLTGLYLTLATFAFGQLMDRLVFQSEKFGFGQSNGLPAPRPGIFGTGLGGDRVYLVMLAAVFAVLGIGLLAVRRGRYGRLLIAMRDSPAACDTLGLDPRRFKVLLFMSSAGIAGLAGVLWAGLRQGAGSSDFQVMASLPLLLLAVVCGVTTVSGALIGGFALMLLPVIQSSNGNAVGGAVLLVIGLAAVGLGRDPNGLVSFAITGGRALLRTVGLEAAAGPTAGAGRDSSAGKDSTTGRDTGQSAPAPGTDQADGVHPRSTDASDGPRNEEVRAGGTA